MIEPNTEAIDRFAVSGWFIFLAFAVGFLCTGFVIMDSAVRPPVQENRQAVFIEALGLSHAALVPSARSERAPEQRHPGIDLRFTPALPGTPPDPIDLLVENPHAWRKKALR